ncbi:MAG: recombination-associated protein RdgC [Gammaproteobacteria bacterium]|nr:recombination-associated protein RdgC [Gammaproteobacteria bacterium]
MWFRNVQLFSLGHEIAYEQSALAEALQQLVFTPCLATLPSTTGWVSPTDNEFGSLVYANNGCLMICLQVEEKLLPATVVQQRLKERVQEIESEYERKVYGKEKQSLRDDIYHALLPQAFSKKSKIYAYIDTKHGWLALNTTTAKKTELFMDAWKKVMPDIQLIRPELKKLTTIMTHWLQNSSQPDVFEFGKNCLLQDPAQQNRKLRCQQQDLLAQSMQPIIKDGFEVSQITLVWQDQVSFHLADDFSVRSLRFQDELIEAAYEEADGDKDARFAADFLIMTETFRKLLPDLTTVFYK